MPEACRRSRQPAGHVGGTNQACRGAPMTTRILALGGAHLDRIGRIAGDTAPGARNPGSWTEDIGGGSFNVARNLAILGHRVTMVSPRGGDAIGERRTDERRVGKGCGSTCKSVSVAYR